MCESFITKHANVVTCLHGDLSAKRKVKAATLKYQQAVFRVVNVNLHLDKAKFVSESVESGSIPYSVLKQPKESDNKLTSNADYNLRISIGHFQWNQPELPVESTKIHQVSEIDI